jgi:hypothetical protein
MTLKQFQFGEHFPFVADWLEKQKCPIPPRDLLPPTGIIVYMKGLPVCAGFLVKTDCCVAMISHLVADPDVHGEDRAAAIDALVESLTAIAMKDGWKSVSGACAETLPGMNARYNRLGFIKTDTGISHYGRIF